MKQPINFEEIINNKIFEGYQDKNNDAQPDKKFRPSSAGFCERQMFLSKTGLKKFDKSAIGAMKAGSLLHEWIEKDLKEKGIVEKSVMIEFKDIDSNPNELYYEGTFDFYDHSILYDFKSTSNLNYVDGISNIHKDQLLIYMKGLGAAKGSVVYIDKRDLKAKQYFLDFDESRIKQIFKKTNEVYEAFIKWKTNGMNAKNIPFEKCGCFMCRYEVIEK